MVLQTAPAKANSFSLSSPVSDPKMRVQPGELGKLVSVQCTRFTRLCNPMEGDPGYTATLLFARGLKC